MWDGSLRDSGIGRESRGTTLVEVLVGLVLLLLVASLSVGIYLRFDRSLTILGERLAAWDLLESQVETWRARGTAPSGEFRESVDRLGIGRYSSGSAELVTKGEPVPGIPELVRVTVTLTWDEGARRAELVTYVGPRGPVR